MPGVTRTTFVMTCCWVACVLSAPVLESARQSRPNPPNLPENNPYASAADVEAGRVLYVGRCGHCHGLSGEGGRGVVLNTGQFHRGDSDRDLFLVVRNGVPFSEMAGVPGLPEIDIWRMVAYVRQLGRQGASDPVTGDATAGSRVYQSHGCAGCHNIDSSAWGPTPTLAAGADSQGGFMGPALTDVGAKRSPRYLRESIVNPNADIPLDYRSVMVVTAAGARITGIHLNEDEYSIHLRETSGILRSFLKSELTEITLTGRSLMPASGALSKDDLDNLVAYLSSLRPKR